MTAVTKTTLRKAAEKAPLKTAKSGDAPALAKAVASGPPRRETLG